MGCLYCGSRTPNRICGPCRRARESEERMQQQLDEDEIDE